MTITEEKLAVVDSHFSAIVIWDISAIFGIYIHAGMRTHTEIFISIGYKGLDTRGM